MRKLAGLTVMVFLALLIAACGDEDDGGDATEEATVATEAAEPTEETLEPAGTSTPASFGDTPITPATPATMATPASAVMPIPASPAATPAAMATPVSGGAVAVPAGAGATPSTGAVMLRGEVTLPGTLGETFVIAEDGCVGLNGYSDMRAGRQLVVRNETGTIIGVTEVEASDASDACSWTFSLDVPRAEFYAVSVPMEVERVFSRDEVEASGGEVTVPLR